MTALDTTVVLNVFKEFGFSIDFSNQVINVLRGMEFPFRRVTIPNRPTLSVQLLEAYLRDTGIDGTRFMKVYQRFAKPGL